MKILIISRWNTLYENKGSRKLVKLRAVQVTNTFISERYHELLAHPKSAPIFSAFVLMCQVASTCTPRGALLRDNGKPHDAHSLAIKTHAPAAWFRLAIPYLLANHTAHEPGWLEEIEVEAATELASHGCFFAPKSAPPGADFHENPPAGVTSDRRITGGNAPPSVVLDCIPSPQTPRGGALEVGGAIHAAALAARGRESERAFPPTLEQPAFRKAWDDWIAHLQSKHRDMVSLSTIDLHFEQCRKWGPAAAIAAIDHCRASNYSRLELPREFSSSATSSPHESRNHHSIRPGANARAYANTDDYSAA